MIEKSTRLLSSKKEICAYLGNISEHIFNKLVKAGMLAVYMDGRWYASTANLDRFIDAWTNVSCKNIVDKIPEEE